VAPGERVVIAEPTFSELAVAALAQGAVVERVFSELPGFALDLERVARRAEGARLVYLCTPNNPTGEAIEHERVLRLAERLGDTLLLLDQSFKSLSDQASEPLVRLPANVIAVRSLTKDFALPGLRIGYGVAEAERVRAIAQQRPTWATSASALAAIEAAASERAFVASSWLRMRVDREHLTAGLVALGLAPRPSAAGYVLVEVGDARTVREALLRQSGVQVRDASSFGLPRHVRIAARPHADTQRVLDGLARLFA
jgi:histidinol-phosphate aminotransferase